MAQAAVQWQQRGKAHSETNLDSLVTREVAGETFAAQSQDVHGLARLSSHAHSLRIVLAVSALRQLD